MHRLLLLDLDGTIRETKSGETFINTPTDQKLIQSSIDVMREAVRNEWVLVGITNQGGVAAGHKTLENCILEMKFCIELFPEIESIYLCPDFEGIECWKVWGNCSLEKCINYKNKTITVPFGSDGLIAEGYKNVLAEPDLNFRKPGAGMLKLAIDFYKLKQVLYVGDREEDKLAAEAAGVEFMWADVWRGDEKKL